MQGHCHVGNGHKIFRNQNRYILLKCPFLDTMLHISMCVLNEDQFTLIISEFHNAILKVRYSPQLPPARLPAKENSTGWIKN